MKISIVTAVLNREESIERCLLSVSEQDYPNVEHIIIDGGSTDGTLAILRASEADISAMISEPDDGIYDALNKGFAMATGDVVGVLHSDDIFFNSSVLSAVMSEFSKGSLDLVYGDLAMIRPDGSCGRYWRTGFIGDGGITGSQIPHPALFISSRMLKKLVKPFDDSYKIAADLKQQLLLVNTLGAKTHYLPMPLVKMRLGGTSTSGLKAYAQGWIESRRAWNEVQGDGGIVFVLKKVTFKITGGLLRKLSSW